MKIREQVLAEEPICRECIRTGRVNKDSTSVVVDHIRPLADGGTDERSNWAGMCKLHHDEKTAAESARAQGRTVPRVKRRIAADGWPVE
jgi:5-methylcytosine-specific restriction protein A